MSDDDIDEDFDDEEDTDEFGSEDDTGDFDPDAEDAAKDGVPGLFDEDEPEEDA